MTEYWELLVVLTAAINPPATAAVSSSFANSAQRRALAVATGVVFGTGLVMGAAFSAKPLLSSLELSHETFRLAAGAILVVTGARETWRGGPPLVAIPERAWEQGIYPLGIPLFASPAGLTATIALAADGAVGPLTTLGAALPVLAVAAAAALCARREEAGIWRAAAQLVGALSVMVGVAFVVAGIRSV